MLRLGLLGSIAWITQLTQPVLTLFGHDLSWRDLIPIGGGLFLVWEATSEIHHHVLPAGHAIGTGGAVAQLIAWGVISQIVMLDLVFSVDSIVTKVEEVRKNRTYLS